MSYHIHPLDATIDLPRLVELVNIVNPEPISEETFRARQEQSIPGQVRYTVVAIDEEGVIGGFVSVVRHPWMAPGQFYEASSCACSAAVHLSQHDTMVTGSSNTRSCRASL